VGANRSQTAADSNFMITNDSPYTHPVFTVLLANPPLWLAVIGSRPTDRQTNNRWWHRGDLQYDQIKMRKKIRN